MLNKNDPLIGAVQEVMKRNQAEREAAKLVNEKFGVSDRKALPHERQGEWDAAYKTVLTEGVEALDELKGITSNTGARAGYMLKGIGSAVGAKLRGDKKTYNKRMKGLEGAKKKSETDTEKRKQDVFNNETARKVLKDMGRKTGYGDIYDKMFEEEKSFAALAPPFDKPTQKDRLVGAGVLKKHPTQPGKHILAKEGTDGDTTSPSSMGIKGPDYATGTPAYANKGPQMVNRAAKTSLPAGTVAKSIKEENLEEKAVSKAQHRFFGLVRGIQKGKAHGSAKAEKAASSMSAKSVKDYAKTKEKGLPEKVNEASVNAATGGLTATDSQRRAGYSVTNVRDTAYGKNPTPKASAGPAASTGAQGPSPVPTSAAVIPKASMSGGGSMSANRASLAASAAKRANMSGGGANKPAAVSGGARPSPNIGKNSPSGSQASTGLQVGGARPGLVAPASPAKKPYQTGAGAMANPTQRAYDSKTSPAAKQTFSQAFAAARKQAGGAGGKFTYKGKEYQTNIKGEKYKAAKSLKSVGSSSAKPATNKPATAAPKPTARPAGVGSSGPARPTMAANAKSAGQMAVNRMKAQRAAVTQTPSMSAGMSKTAPAPVRKPTPTFGGPK